MLTSTTSRYATWTSERRSNQLDIIHSFFSQAKRAITFKRYVGTYGLTLSAYEDEPGYIVVLTATCSEIVSYAIRTDFKLIPIVIRVLRSVEDHYHGIAGVRDF